MLAFYMEFVASEEGSMIRAVFFGITMLISTHAIASWDVVKLFVSQIEVIPSALDQLIRVSVNTPIEVVSCQVRQESLKEIQAPLLEIIASKTSLKTRLEAYVISPKPDRWSRITSSVSGLVMDLHRLAEESGKKSEQFAHEIDLSNAYIDLQSSIRGGKIDILLDLERVSASEDEEVLNELSDAAKNLGAEIDRLRTVKDAIALELGKGC